MKVLRPGSIDAKDMASREWAAWARDQLLEHGKYTPALTNVTNVTSSTPAECQWSRVGNVVTVSGGVSITATAAGAAAINLSLPVASLFTGGQQCAGTACTTTFIVGYIAGNVSSAKLSFTAAGAGAVTVYFSFIYWVQ